MFIATLVQCRSNNPKLHLCKARPPPPQIKQQQRYQQPSLHKTPSGVASGKVVAERTQLARVVQKKTAAEAAVIITINQAKKVQAPEQAPKPASQTPSIARRLSTTQWLAVASIVVSLTGLYYKGEEVKAALKRSAPAPATVPDSCACA